LEELLAAWERVQENDGCAGADGVTIQRFSSDAPARIERLLNLVANHQYRPFPLLQIIVEKKSGSVRKISADQSEDRTATDASSVRVKSTRTLLVPAVRDRILQTVAARQLSRSFEEEFLECS